MENKPFKSGIILEKIVPTDYIFGVSTLDTTIKVENGDWTPFLPANEKQRQGFESMCCTNFSSTSAVEILMTRLIETKLISVGNLKWLNDKGYLDDSGHINFSDRFDALVSGTKLNEGNTLKAPADAKHKYGLIPEKMLSWTDDEVAYFDKAKITPEMYSLGKEFLTRFPINYEMVYRKDFVSAMKVSPLAGACHAWGTTSMEVYVKTTAPINHAIAIIDPPTIWKIFDSYDPFLKNLADNYIFLDYALRYIVRENTDVPDSSQKKNMYILRRNPDDNEEIFAFTEDWKFKRHVVNKETLIAGARPKDQYWVWDESIVIPWATPTEFQVAEELSEILLLPKDSSISINAGEKFSLWKWIKSLFGIK